MHDWTEHLTSGLRLLLILSKIVERLQSYTKSFYEDIPQLFQCQITKFSKP